jgi:hypothetical protein
LHPKNLDINLLSIPIYCIPPDNDSIVRRFFE